jgi:1-acyl-sn-glycerol-3-phosphate acyltransferase
MGFGYWVRKHGSGWQDGNRGDLLQSARKCVLVAAPHTSNWIWVYSRFGLFIMKVPAYYLLKKEWVVFL